MGRGSEFWTYMAVVIDGEYFVFPTMTFEMSCAVEVYCSVEGEKHRCLRNMGLRLVRYIDDRASPYINKIAEAEWRRVQVPEGSFTIIGGTETHGGAWGERGGGEVWHLSPRTWHPHGAASAMTAHEKKIHSIFREHLFGQNPIKMWRSVFGRSDEEWTSFCRAQRFGA
jgi:hypothetical protein